MIILFGGANYIAMNALQNIMNSKLLELCGIKKH
jgi:hypothetical protein